MTTVTAALAPESPARPAPPTDAELAAAFHGVRGPLTARGEQVVAWVFWGLAVLCLVFSYPLAFAWPKQVAMLFEYTLPTPQVMTLAALLVILTGRSRPRWWLALPLAVYGLGLGLNLAVNPEHPLAYLELLGYVLIPWAVAVMRREGTMPSMVTLSTVLLGIWLYQILQGQAALVGSLSDPKAPTLLRGVTQVFQFLLGYDGQITSVQPVGLGGNVNWEACYMLVLAPFAWYALRHWLTRAPQHLVLGLLLLLAGFALLQNLIYWNMPKAPVSPDAKGLSLPVKILLTLLFFAAWVTLSIWLHAALTRLWRTLPPMQPWVVTAMAGACVGVGSAVVLQGCNSRAAYLAVMVLPFAVIFWRLGPLNRALFLVFSVLLAITPAFAALKLAGPDTQAKLQRKLEQTVREDVRLPMWGRTLAMTLQNDAIGRRLRDAWRAARGQGDRVDPALALAARARPGSSGVGAGNFQRDFAPYRATSRYSARRVAADTSVHPHNEPLNVAAQLGLLPALAWVLTMLLALRPPRGALDWVASIAAFLGLFCALFDMPLVRAPASLAVWLAVGLRLGDGLLPLPPGFSREQVVMLRKVIASLAVLVLACGGLWLVQRDLRFAGFYREGRMQSYYGRHAESVQAGRQALAVQPEQMLARYHLAQTLLHDLNDHEAAARELEHLYARDPNYIHLNRMLYLTKLQEGDVKAAVAHAAREVDLYPNSPTALQDLIFILALLGEYPRTVELYARHNTRVVGHLVRDNPPDALRAALQGAIDPARAKADPSAVCEALNRAFLTADERQLRFEDPVFIDACVGRPWAAAMRSYRFRPDDVAFWRLCGDLRSLIPEAPDRLQGTEAALRALRRRVSLDPARSGFTLPTQLMDGEAGNAWSLYALGSLLAYLQDMPAAVQVDEAGQAVALVVMDRDRVLIYECVQDKAVILPLNAWRGTLGSVHPLRVYFPYAMCQLRNQMLAQAVEDVLGVRGRLPNMVPFQVMALQYGVWTGTAPSFDDLGRVFATVELDALDRATADLQKPRAP